MKTLKALLPTAYSLLLVACCLMAIACSSCSKDSNPLTAPTSPGNNNGTLVYAAPDTIYSTFHRLLDGFDLTGYDSLVITYDFKEGHTGQDTAHIFHVNLSTYDSTYTYPVNNWELPFQKTYEYVSYRVNIKAPYWKKLYHIYLFASGSSNVFTIRNLKIYKK